VRKVAIRAAGATSKTEKPKPTRIGPEDRAAADPVDTADRPHRQGDEDDLPVASPTRQPGRRRRRGEGEPGAERDQDRGDDIEERLAAAEQEDPDHGAGDDAGKGAEDEQPGQRPGQPALAVKARQRAGDRDQVVEEVGRRHRRARRVDDADLEGDEEDRTGYADRRRHHRQAEGHRRAEDRVAQHGGGV
jgi:hypothetical protein